MPSIATVERPRPGPLSRPRPRPAEAVHLDPSRTPADEGCARQVVPSSVWFCPGLSGGQVRELLAFLGVHNGVAVLQWPRDARHVEALAEVGLPRLLLVHPSPQAPPADGPLQTALPSAADDGDIHGSLMRLSGRAAHWRSTAGRPSFDDGTAMRVADRRIELTPVELRLAIVLVARFGRPVDDELLLAGETPHLSLTDARLRGHLARLNALVNPLGLEVRAAGAGGHVMRWCAA